jgi:hypothetical protein
VKTDLSLNNVENTALSTWAGSANLVTVGTITTGTWHGTALTSSFLPSAIVYNNQSNTYTAGMKQIFGSSTTTAGLNFAGTTADPSSPANGDVWLNTTSNTSSTGRTL